MVSPVPPTSCTLLCEDQGQQTKCEIYLETYASSTSHFLPRHVQTIVRRRPLDAFLTEAGPVFDRHIRCTKAIARVVLQVSPKNEKSPTVVGQMSILCLSVRASMLTTFLSSLIYIGLNSPISSSQRCSLVVTQALRNPKENCTQYI